MIADYLADHAVLITSVSWCLRPTLVFTKAVSGSQRHCWCAAFRLEVSQQTVERLPIVIVILPAAEVRNEVFANLTCGVLAGVGIEAFEVTQRVKIDEPKGKQHTST